jgi:hypothetical protein
MNWSNIHLSNTPTRRVPSNQGKCRADKCNATGIRSAVALHLACSAFFVIMSCTSSHCANLFKLADLSTQQRTELFAQIDAYGLLTAMLNFCQRPPKLEERLTPVVDGCVDKESFAAVVKRYNAAVQREGGRWDCSDRGLRTMIPKYEAKIDGLVSSMKTACRLRSFYNISFPKINFP